MDDVTALRDALVAALPSRYFHREDMDNLDVLAALDALIASAEQRGRDQWLHATAHGTRQWEGLLAKYDLAEDADASSVIAAVEARAALTPERLAKALVATTIFAGHAIDCPVWMNRMIELRGERVDLDTCTCWVKDEAPDRARRILAALPRDPVQGSGAPTNLPAPADRGGSEEPRVERCTWCGVGRWVIAHDPEAGPSYHPYTPEVR